MTDSEKNPDSDSLKNGFQNDVLDINPNEGNKKEYHVEGKVYEVAQTEVQPKKASSFVTILSIWNTMIGSSTVTMPYCVANAGLIPAVLLNMLFVSICFYTCRIVVKTGGKDKDYCDTVSRYFGQKYGYVGRVLQILFNLSINVGATLIYFLTINQNLYPCLALLLKTLFKLNIDPDNITPSFSQFSLLYCGIILCVIAFPLFVLKEMGLIVKINSFGIYLVSFLLGFVVYTGISSLFNTSFLFDYYNNISQGPRYLYLFGAHPSILAGTLSLGYFSHSFVLPMMENNAKQENNQRDLLIGYLCVMTTYIVAGTLGYIGFSGERFNPKFQDNWFRFFPSDDIFMIVLRMINVFQLTSILPVLYYIVRIQFFGTFWGNSYPGKVHVYSFSVCLSLLCLIVLYFCYNSLGKMLGIVGASTGLFLIYFIPLIVNIVYYNRRHPDNLEDLQKEQKNNLLGAEDKVKPAGEQEDKDDYGVSEKPRNKFKDIMFYISQYGLMLFGIFTLVIQFVDINFFGIVLKDKPTVPL